MVERFVTGRKFFMSPVSKPGFFSSGVTKPCFMTAGKVPDVKETFARWAIALTILDLHYFSTETGMMSIGDVLDGIC